jgi:hypothetical protein
MLIVPTHSHAYWHHYVCCAVGPHDSVDAGIVVEMLCDTGTADVMIGYNWEKYR